MKTQTAFRIDTSLLELIKEKAKKQRRSLNNYIENLLYKDIESEPNEETIKAINDAENNKNLTKIDNLDSFLKDL
ncbi:MAG: hypothetical protein HRT66_01990 [Flavobacteriaceae bacterium]|nr:hypothetical protein [Flavobacteriaceae bacterium]